MAKLQLTCSQCNNNFERKYKKSEAAKDKHFCSNSCSRLYANATVSFEERQQKSAKAREKLSQRTKEQWQESFIKTKETFLKRYGVENCSSLDEVKFKKKETTLKNYGVEHPMHSNEIKANMKNAIIEKYGVEHPMHLQEIKTKVRTTFKENGNQFRASKPENKLYDILCELFSTEKVQRNAIINDWDIDFCIKLDNENVYMQLDGVYWHGLDRPKETQENKSILKTMERDIQQNLWFEKNKLKLVRITDIQLLEYIRNNVTTDNIQKLVDVGQGR